MFVSETIGKCINHTDKNLLIRIIDNAIITEIKELKSIESKAQEFSQRPADLKRYSKIRPFLKLQHETFKTNIEKLKVKIQNTPECDLQLIKTM